MELEIYSVVAAVILGATMLTAVFTLATYAVFQFRRRRTASSVSPRTTPAPQFFRRYEAAE